MTVFERIKFLAKKHSKTMKQVTIDLGYSENYFYSLKSGKQPSAEKLTEIANYFNVSVDYLLGITNNSKDGDSQLPPTDLDDALDEAMTWNGKPLTDQDKEAVRIFLQGRKSEWGCSVWITSKIC